MAPSFGESVFTPTEFTVVENLNEPPCYYVRDENGVLRKYNLALQHISTNPIEPTPSDRIMDYMGVWNNAFQPTTVTINMGTDEEMYSIIFGRAVKDWEEDVEPPEELMDFLNDADGDGGGFSDVS